jgi:hypothetical protein
MEKGCIVKILEYNDVDPLKVLYLYQLSLEVMDMAGNDPRYQMWSTIGDPAPANVVATGFVYGSTVPETLRVTFNTISVLANGSWKVQWFPSHP